MRRRVALACSVLAMLMASCSPPASDAPATAETERDGLSAETERRCGWYANPTPGNLELIDRDAAWSITSQGEAAGPNATDADNAPDFDGGEFVSTQSGYGYGCACMNVETDGRRRRISRVISGEILPLARCRADTSLPPPPR